MFRQSSATPIPPSSHPSEVRLSSNGSESQSKHIHHSRTPAVDWGHTLPPHAKVSSKPCLTDVTSNVCVTLRHFPRMTFCHTAEPLCFHCECQCHRNPSRRQQSPPEDTCRGMGFFPAARRNGTPMLGAARLVRSLPPVGVEPPAIRRLFYGPLTRHASQGELRP